MPQKGLLKKTADTADTADQVINTGTPKTHDTFMSTTHRWQTPNKKKKKKTARTTMNIVDVNSSIHTSIPNAFLVTDLL